MTLWGLGTSIRLPQCRGQEEHGMHRLVTQRLCQQQSSMNATCKLACQAPGLHDVLMQQRASQPEVVLACQGARPTRQLSPGFLWEEEKGVW